MKRSTATRIEFTLQESDQVTLTIADVLGREVDHLVDQNLPAGPHRVLWDGLCSDGRAAGSGTYFARLHTGRGEEVTRALTLLR